jgi:hypothetical protein
LEGNSESTTWVAAVNVSGELLGMLVVFGSEVGKEANVLSEIEVLKEML